MWPKRERRLKLLALAALLGCAPVATALPPVALAAAEAPSARPQIGRPVQQAEQLLKERKFKEALAKLAEADAVAHKTPYESYLIEATHAAVLLQSGDYPGTIKALEAALATGMLAPADALNRVETLVKLCYQTKDYAKLRQYAERYYREGGTDEEPHLLLAEAAYQQGDFAAAAAGSGAIVAADERAGRAPPEPVLQMLASSEYRQQHDAAYQGALMQLVTHYPKREYWAELIAAVQKKPGFSDRLALDVARLKVATGTMATPADYVDAAQRALLAGLPGDAKSFLTKGYAAGVLGKGADAARQQRLAAMAEQQASDDQKALAAKAKEAEAARSGLPAMRLGEAYASYGRYADAIAALEQGLKKGGLDHPEEATLHLGIACLAAGDKAKGAAVLRGVAGEDGARDLAQLWLIAGGASASEH
jgi:tetratricopeptide (TPR) repeat protein